MKKILSALLAALMLLSATACAAHEPVLPPSRWGEGESQGMLPHTYSLSEAYDAAEVVALVTVGDWLEEELITGRTFFRTTVQKVYKGDIPHEFVLAQEGCSTWTYRKSRIHLWQSAAAVLDQIRCVHVPGYLRPGRVSGRL